MSCERLPKTGEEAIKELEAIRDLIRKWREDADYPISKAAHPFDREKMEAIKVETRQCVRELEALLPALEAAFVALRKSKQGLAWQQGHASRDSEVAKMEAEIAALTETMPCEHPKACWREPSSVHPDGHCSMCVEKRLAVAALREEIVALYQKMNGQEPGDEDAFVRAVLKQEKRGEK